MLQPTARDQPTEPDRTPVESTVLYLRSPVEIRPRPATGDLCYVLSDLFT